MIATALDWRARLDYAFNNPGITQPAAVTHEQREQLFDSVLGCSLFHRRSASGPYWLNYYREWDQQRESISRGGGGAGAAGPSAGHGPAPASTGN
jgi:hypothetical protein